MGCGPSASKKAMPVQEPTANADIYASGLYGAILVESAKGLRNADQCGGSSDPYAIARLGQVGSTWEQKGKSSEHRSVTVRGTVDPVWQFAFTYLKPKEEAQLEMHLRVYDSDLLSADDFLGEVKVLVSELSEKEDTLIEYPLSGDKGTVTIMSGSRVEEALAKEMKDALAQEDDQVWFPKLRAVTNKLGQYFTNAAAAPIYWANMGRLGLGWAGRVGQNEDGSGDPSSELFTKLTTDPKTGEDTLQWAGPESQNCVTHNGHPFIAKTLEELGAKLGTNDGDGTVLKPNFLGFQMLNSKCWPEVPWHAIGLGAPQEPHAVIRPIITKLCGPGGMWSPQMLADEAHAFFLGRESIHVSKDLNIWVTRVLHKVFLGLELAEREADDFRDFKYKMLLLIAIPDAALDSAAIGGLVSYQETMARKKQWLQRYEPLLRERLPQETAAMKPEEVTWLASAVLDALLFAGGQSVPTMLGFCLTLPYSKWGAQNLPEDFVLEDTSKLAMYIWEVIRRFPPVAGFIVTERSAGTGAPQNLYLNLQMAQRDPQVWGADAANFVLRPLSEYHMKSVGFAEPAVAPNVGSPNAHSCPAQDLAFNMVYSFMKAFAQTSAGVAGGHKALWVPRPEDGGIEGEKGALIQMAPEDFKINLYGVNTYMLTKETGLLAPGETDRSGQAIFDALPPAEQRKIEEEVAKHCKMDDTNLHTRLMMYAVEAVVHPETEGSSLRASLPKEKRVMTESDLWLAPFGGLKFAKKDEEEEPGRLDKLLDIIVNNVMTATAKLNDAEELNELVWFATPAEAVTCMEAKFGRHLPMQYVEWDDMRSDDAMVALCIYGIGAWYLKNASTAEDAGHEVPEGAELEVNMEYMCNYETRGHWMRYGHTAYLSPERQPGSLLSREILGIYICDTQTMVRPGEGQWEEAKAGFRSTLGTTITLRDHLTHCHWVYANGLSLAARQYLGKNHPLRRLLKQFHHKTADINFKSKEILLPVDGLAHRSFAFTDESWLAYFTDLLANWQWVPFPERVAQANLSPEFMARFPLYHDGMLLWNAFSKYVTNFLAIFYQQDGDITADAEICEFWASFETQLDTPWKLPPLTLANLTCLLTDIIFAVTAGHEFVGAVVEYLTSPFGCASKLLRGRREPDVQTYTQDLIIIALTGIRQPALLDDWTHMMKEAGWEATKEQAALELVRQFQVELIEVSDAIENENLQRERRGERRFVAFDPRVLETSVSI